MGLAGNILQTSGAAGIKSNRTHGRARTSTISPDSLNTGSTVSVRLPWLRCCLARRQPYYHVVLYESEPARARQEGHVETLQRLQPARPSAPACRPLQFSRALLYAPAEAAQHGPRNPLPFPGDEHHSTCLPWHLLTTAPWPPGGQRPTREGADCWNRVAMAHALGRGGRGDGWAAPSSIPTWSEHPNDAQDHTTETPQLLGH